MPWRIPILAMTLIPAIFAGFACKKTDRRDLHHDGSLGCMHQLSAIGGELIWLKASRRLRLYNGAAFLLQAKDRVSEGSLHYFLCPNDRGERGGRPPIGSAALTDWYRNLTLPGGVDEAYCSYAGPDWRRRPPGKDDGRKKTRLWACCRCPDGVTRHNGLVVLWSTGSVEKIPLEEIEGYDYEEDVVVIGPDSPDARLRDLCFR